MTLFGQRQIVIVNEASVSGHAIANGETLWEFEWPGQSNAGANCSQALWIDESRVFLSKGYRGGCKLLDFSKTTPTTKVVYVAWQSTNLMKTKFTNVVLRDGFIYGLSDGILECIRVADGEQMWKDSRRGRFGHGQLLLVGKHLLISAEDGRCVLARAEPEQSTILGEIELFSDTTWNPLAVAGNLVLLRNAEEAACLEIAAFKDR
jgi:outer membrane protein assembly factor BamB